MKGDANASRDPRPVSIDQIETKVLYRIPRVGYLVSFIDSPLGVLLLIVAPVTMLAIWSRRGKPASSKRISLTKRLGLATRKRKPHANPEVIEEASASGAHSHTVRTRDPEEEVFHVIPRNADQDYAD